MDVLVLWMERVDPGGMATQFSFDQLKSHPNFEEFDLVWHKIGGKVLLNLRSAISVSASFRRYRRQRIFWGDIQIIKNNKTYGTRKSNCNLERTKGQRIIPEQQG